MCRDRSRNTPCHHAALYNRVDIVKWCIENGFDVNMAGDQGYTSLHFAAKHGWVPSGRCCGGRVGVAAVGQLWQLAVAALPCQSATSMHRASCCSRIGCFIFLSRALFLSRACARSLSLPDAPSHPFVSPHPFSLLSPLFSLSRTRSLTRSLFLSLSISCALFSSLPLPLSLSLSPPGPRRYGEMVAYLLDAGASISALSGDQKTPAMVWSFINPRP